MIHQQFQNNLHKQWWKSEGNTWLKVILKVVSVFVFSLLDSTWKLKTQGETMKCLCYVWSHEVGSVQSPYSFLWQWGCVHSGGTNVGQRLKYSHHYMITKKKNAPGAREGFRYFFLIIVCVRFFTHKQSLLFFFLVRHLTFLIWVKDFHPFKRVWRE